MAASFGLCIGMRFGIKIMNADAHIRCQPKLMTKGQLTFQRISRFEKVLSPQTNNNMPKGLDISAYLHFGGSMV